MNIESASILVTGGGSGIGAALASEFLKRGARAVAVVDIDEGAANTVADALGSRVTALTCDVTAREAVRALVEEVDAAFGGLDLICSNAGIASGEGVEADTATWDRVWAVNVMGSVNMAAAYLPLVRERSAGHLMITASAAGLLTNLGDAPYTATKHAAVGLAEWLTITHGDEGLGVSCLCPQGVRTPMVMSGLQAGEEAAAVVELMGLISPEECAIAAADGLENDEFLILPHPDVATFQHAKAENLGRWLGGMRKLQRRLRQGG